jgi:tRNA-2-methylthio-N6-dimethylallyladenosine synthase
LVNTAAYSPRPGTPAATWNNQVTNEEKQDRLQRMQVVMSRHAQERSDRYVGTVQRVLVEDIDPKHVTHVSGRNPQNRPVFFKGNYQNLRGKTVSVLITEARPYSLTGTMLTGDCDSSISSD